MSIKKKSGEVLVTLKEKKEKIRAKDVSDVLLVALRVRGNVDKIHYIKKTFSLLRLFRKNHAVLLKATKPINGMLFKLKDFIAYGILEKETLVKMLKKKARIKGNKPFDVKSVKILTGKDSYEDLADALMNFEITFSDIKDIIPVFRLHPPRKGFAKGIKVQVTQGGVLGFHGKGINSLIDRMV
ncbi:MAG: 50S ribosomal protein L30 [Promethearchaeota archaeon]